MSGSNRYDLEQTRKQWPSIVADAHAGKACIITKHGKPYAAIVPIEEFEQTRATANAGSGLLALRGTGRGLWGADVGQTLTDLRKEWGDA